MNHRQLLHSFDALKEPSIEKLATACKTKKPPTTLGQIRVFIRSNQIDPEAMEKSIADCQTGPEPTSAAPEKTPPVKKKDNSNDTPKP